MMKQSARLFLLIFAIGALAPAAEAGPRYGLEAGLGIGAMPVGDAFAVAPPAESRQAPGYRIGGIADWSFAHGLGGSAVLRYDELAFGSHVPVASQSGTTAALWSDRRTVFRQITFAPGASVHLLPRTRLHLSPQLGYLIAARQVDDLAPGPALTPFGHAAVGFAPEAVIFEQAGSRLTTDVTDGYQRFRLGFAADLSYEHPVGAHALRVAAGAHQYAARGESFARSYTDWRTSLSWLN